MCSPLQTFQNRKALLYEIALDVTSQVPAGLLSLDASLCICTLECVVSVHAKCVFKSVT